MRHVHTRLQQQQQYKLYLHDYNYVVTVLQKLWYKKQTNKQTNHNNDNAMMTVVNQVSSAWLDNKLLRKSLHNETNFNKCEFTEKFCEFINLIINSV